MGIKICKITAAWNDHQAGTINKSPPPEQKPMSTGTVLSHIFHPMSPLSPLFLQRSADAYSEVIRFKHSKKCWCCSGSLKKIISFSSHNMVKSSGRCHFPICDFLTDRLEFHQLKYSACTLKTLPEAQRNQGIDSFNLSYLSSLIECHLH